MYRQTLLLSVSAPSVYLVTCVAWLLAQTRCEICHVTKVWHQTEVSDSLGSTYSDISVKRNQLLPGLQTCLLSLTRLFAQICSRPTVHSSLRESDGVVWSVDSAEITTSVTSMAGISSSPLLLFFSSSLSPTHSQVQES